ncbi:hypothetical protein ACHAWX_004512 [Stephanocyclus meneghinianus]
MFSNIFQRKNPAPRQNYRAYDDDYYYDEDDTTTTTTTTSTQKSILRKSGARRTKKIRNVSWSETFETLDRDDVACEDAFERREDDESLIEDFNWADDETRQTVEEDDDDGRAVVNSYCVESGTYASSEAMTGEEGDASCVDGGLTQRMDRAETMGSTRSNEMQKVDNNENLELRNLACTSNVSDATELTDKYGLTEEDAKRTHTRNNQLISCDSYISDVSTIGDKYHGLHCDETDALNVGVNPTPQIIVPTPTTAAAAIQEDRDKSLPILDDANVFVPVLADTPDMDYDIDYASSNDSLTVGTPSAEELGNSFDEDNPLHRHANSDEGSLASLKKKEHGYEEIIREQNKADRSHGHIGLILPFLSRLQCGAFMDDASIFKSWEPDVVAEDLQKKSYDDQILMEDARSSGNEPVQTGVLEELPSDVPDDQIEVVDETITCLDDEEQANAGHISSRKIEELDAKFDTMETNNDEDADGSATSDHGERSKDENTSQSSETSNKSSKKSSRSSHSPTETKSHTSIRSDDESALSPQIGNIISFHAAEDDSIPSNESNDDNRGQTNKTKKTVFHPLASFRKQVSRAASNMVGKNGKSKTSNSKSRTSKVQNSQYTAPRMYASDSLHDRVYHEVRPERQAHLTTELILNDLQIIEDTAKVMYQDRFNNTPSLLDPTDDSDDIRVNNSTTTKKRKGKLVGIKADDGSERTKASTQSSLSRIFDDYFQCNK